MKKAVATICCVLTLFQASLVAAEPGPLLKASLEKDPQKQFRADVPSRPLAKADDDDQNTGSWMERHPVWAGTLIGFGAGFLITYAIGASEDHSHELLTPVDAGGPALVFGGVAAGIGALAGWGIGRSRDKNPNPALGGAASVVGKRSR